MKIVCPTCRQTIPAAQLNVATDVAVCTHCGEAFSISEVVATGEGALDFDVHRPPHGAWCDDAGPCWRIGASTRSPAAFFLVPFMCVWSGFSIGGIYGSQIVDGKFELDKSLFGIPFVLGTLALGTMTLMSIFGKIVVSIDGNDGRVFTGVGLIGWTRRFAWETISGIKENLSGFDQSENRRLVISLIGESRLDFGSMLTVPRRYYLLQALRQQLAKRKGEVAPPQYDSRIHGLQDEGNDWWNRIPSWVGFILLAGLITATFVAIFLS